MLPDLLLEVLSQSENSEHPVVCHQLLPVSFALGALRLKLGDVKYKFQLASGLLSRKELLGGCGAQGKKLTLK